MLSEKGTLISKADLGMILLSVVQKMGYDRPTDDQKWQWKHLCLGRTSLYRFQQAAESPCAMPACHMFSMNCEDDLGPGSAWPTIPSSWLCHR